MHGTRAAIVVFATSFGVWALLCAVASCTDPYDAVVPVATDAGADAVDTGVLPGPADAAKTGFCATLARKSVLCADFDDGPALMGPFTGQRGRIFVDQNVAVSQPSSLRAIGAGAFVERTFPASPRPPYILTVAMRIATPEGGTPPLLTPIRFQDDAVSDCSFNIEITPSEAHLSVAATVSDGGRIGQNYPLFQWPKAGSWATVRLEITSGASSVRAAVAVNGIPALALTDTNCPGMTGQPKLTLGVLFGDDAEVSFDDVVLEAD